MVGMRYFSYLLIIIIHYYALLLLVFITYYYSLLLLVFITHHYYIIIIIHYYYSYLLLIIITRIGFQNYHLWFINVIFQAKKKRDFHFCLITKVSIFTLRQLCKIQVLIFYYNCDSLIDAFMIVRQCFLILSYF